MAEVIDDTEGELAGRPGGLDAIFSIIIDHLRVARDRVESPDSFSQIKEMLGRLSEIAERETGKDKAA